MPRKKRTLQAKRQSIKPFRSLCFQVGCFLICLYLYYSDCRLLLVSQFCEFIFMKLQDDRRIDQRCTASESSIEVDDLRKMSALVSPILLCG